MKNDKLIEFKKRTVLEHLQHKWNKDKTLKVENGDNNKELILKSVELYEPISYQELIKLNKKKYRDMKIKILLNHLNEAIKNTYKAIELYKELKNRTEYWEEKTTLDFNFKDWNTIKKVNGKLTTYYKELKQIKNKIEREKNNENIKNYYSGC